MKYLQYDTATGFVRASNSVRVPDDTLPPGVAQTEAPDDLEVGHWAVNVLTGELVELTPPESAAEE